VLNETSKFAQWERYMLNSAKQYGYVEKTLIEGKDQVFIIEDAPAVKSAEFSI
jgi:hypothetical protein